MALGTTQKQPPKVFYKKDALKYSAVFTGKHLCWSLFLIKLKAFSFATLLNRDYNACVFRWILRNFQEHPFWRTSLNGYFWIHHSRRIFVLFNPFFVNAAIIYSLKTPKNQMFSGVLRGYEIGTSVRNRLKICTSEKFSLNLIIKTYNFWSHTHNK